MNAARNPTGMDCLTAVTTRRKCREWENLNLPIFGTLLGSDLILLLTQFYAEGKKPTLKELYLSLPYSENAIRLQLQKLERGGWLAFEYAQHDRRFRGIILEPKLKAVFAQYVEKLIKFANCGTQPKLSTSAPRTRHPLEAPPSNL